MLIILLKPATEFPILFCFLFHLGYYRTASDANSIILADGRREMADSEFGTGTNAEKVTF